MNKLILSIDAFMIELGIYKHTQSFNDVVFLHLRRLKFILGERAGTFHSLYRFAFKRI